MKRIMHNRWIWLIILILPVIFLVGYGQNDDLEKPYVSEIILTKISNANYKELLKIDKEVETGNLDPIILDEEPVPQNDKNIIDDIEVIEEYVKPIINEPSTLPITSRQANDYYPDEEETIATISIPSLSLYQTVIYGDSQSNIDTYDICLRSFHRFDQNGVVLLSGHNYKSFSKLQYINVGDEINIHSYYGDFTFIVDNVTIGTTDGENIYNSDGTPLIDFYSRENKLILYTCDNSNVQSRLFVSAHMQ